MTREKISCPPVYSAQTARQEHQTTKSLNQKIHNIFFSPHNLMDSKPNMEIFPVKFP